MLTTERVKAFWLAALATLFVCTESCIVRASFLRAMDVLPWAVAFDLLAILPAAYVYLVLRPAERPLTELAPVLMLAVACANALLWNVARIRGSLHVLSAAAELTVLSFCVRGVVGTLRAATGDDRDLIWQIHRSSDVWVRWVGLELCIVYYACILPFLRKSNSDSAEAFGADRRVFHVGAQPRQLIVALTLMTVVEVVPVHWLLQVWMPWLSWVVLALTMYSLIWLWGVNQAFAVRPLLVRERDVLVRVSVFFSVTVERETLASVERVAARDPGVTRLAVLAKPNVVVRLAAPVPVYGLFGRARWATCLALHVDQPDELVSVLQAKPARSL